MLATLGLSASLLTLFIIIIISMLLHCPVWSNQNDFCLILDKIIFIAAETSYIKIYIKITTIDGTKVIIYSILTLFILYQYFFLTEVHILQKKKE